MSGHYEPLSPNWSASFLEIAWVFKAAVNSHVLLDPLTPFFCVEAEVLPRDFFQHFKGVFPAMTTGVPGP
jgi:hypothetical protein